ncbi:TolC family protein [Scytonema hofmannii FACHB-248]|uniref:TolC family protein n=1 Tax=Scytonema hofmannii FACHB-248 TaxID=1842502 RepID=A0ABR8GP71_9CYAN|nr:MULTISPECIES: TolC family protein [Nostocales]MBD2605224.1 TolC family protein [Scytonema hofmannii FACHB-248]
MKVQQLFHSFLPGVIVILAIQPASAETVKVNQVQVAASGNVSSSTLTDIINQGLPNTARNSIPDVIKSARTTVTVKPLIRNTIPPTVTGKTGVLIGQKGIVSSWVPSENYFELGDKIRSPIAFEKQSAMSNIKPLGIYSFKLAQNTPASVSQKATTFPAPLTNNKNPDTQLQTVSQVSTSDSTAASLLNKEQICPQQGQSSQNFSLTDGVIDLKACRQRQNNSTGGNSVTQAQTPRTTPITPIPTPAPGGGVQTPTPTPVTPASTQSVEIPDYLNQNPNPLQFPTKPEEVRLQGTQPITLAQALELARRNNRELQVSLFQLKRSQAALREAQAGLLPTLDLNAGINRTQSAGGQRSAEIQGEFANSDLARAQRGNQGIDEPTDSFSGTLQFSYDIYTSGSGSARRRAAHEQVRFQELDVERQSEVIRLNVSTDYYNLQQADESVRINTAAVTNAQASLRDAQALEQAGVGTRFSVLQSQVNLANAQQTLTNSISQQQIARRQLATRLNLSQSVNVVAADPVRLAGLWNQTLEESIILAFQNRPELQQQLAQRNIFEQQRRQALAQIGPQVSLVASYDLQDQFNDNVGVTDGYSVGVQANWRLFDGGLARAQADQRKADIAIAETQFAQQRDQTRFEVEQAFSNLQSNLQNVNTATGALEQARESLRLARLRFQAGVGIQTEVIDAETALTRAEGNRVQAILDYNRALASLQRSVTSRALR